MLVAGGLNGSQFLSTAELYDSATGTWSPTGSMRSPRRFHTATLLPNGKVLVAGGTDSSGISATVRNSTTRPRRPGPRRAHRPPDALGIRRRCCRMGKCSSPVALVTTRFRARVHDPASGTWTTAGGTNAVRVSHTATLLPDGQVLPARASTLSATSGKAGGLK